MSSILGFFSFHKQSRCFQTSPRERDTETKGGGGGGGGVVLETSGRPTFSIKLLVFFEDISNHPPGVYTVNKSFREKVILFDEIM